MRSFAVDTGRDVAVLLEDVDLRVHDWRRRRHLARAHAQAVTEARARRDRRRAGFAFGFRLGVDGADGVGTEELPTDGFGEGVAGEGSAWLGDCVSEDWAGARWWFGAALQGQGLPTMSTSHVADTTALVLPAGNISVATGTPASTLHDDDADVAATDATTEHANAGSSDSDGAAQGRGRLEEEATVLRALQRGVAVLQARQADACLRTGETSPPLRVHVYVSETWTVPTRFSVPADPSHLSCCAARLEVLAAANLCEDLLATWRARVAARSQAFRLPLPRLLLAR